MAVKPICAECQKVLFGFTAASRSLDRSLDCYLLYGLDGPPLGSKVVSLRPGFGSSQPGVEMGVIGTVVHRVRSEEELMAVAPAFREPVPPYIELEGKPNSHNDTTHYLSRRDEWWLDFAVLEEGTGGPLSWEPNH